MDQDQECMSLCMRPNIYPSRSTSVQASRSTLLPSNFPSHQLDNLNFLLLLLLAQVKVRVLGPGTTYTYSRICSFPCNPLVHWRSKGGPCIPPGYPLVTRRIYLALHPGMTALLELGLAQDHRHLHHHLLLHGCPPRKGHQTYRAGTSAQVHQCTCSLCHH